MCWQIKKWNKCADKLRSLEQISVISWDIWLRNKIPRIWNSAAVLYSTSSSWTNRWEEPSAPHQLHCGSLLASSSSPKAARFPAPPEELQRKIFSGRKKRWAWGWGNPSANTDYTRVDLGCPSQQKVVQRLAHALRPSRLLILQNVRHVLNGCRCSGELYPPHRRHQ